jgi:hypothetical protein
LICSVWAATLLSRLEYRSGCCCCCWQGWF